MVEVKIPEANGDRERVSKLRRIAKRHGMRLAKRRRRGINDYYQLQPLTHLTRFMALNEISVLLETLDYQPFRFITTPTWLVSAPAPPIKPEPVHTVNEAQIA